MIGSLLEEKPQKILLPRFDTLGDLVLLEGFVAALQRSLPQSRITLLLRRPYADLSALYPDGLDWMVTDIDPHATDPDPAQCESLLRQVVPIDCDLLLVTAHNRTWADNLVARKIGSARSIALGTWTEMPPHHREVFRAMGLNPANPYTQIVDVPQALHEVGKYDVLWNVLGGQFQLPEPRLNVSEYQLMAAQQILESRDLLVKEYCLLFPAGTQKVPIKVWPAEQFAEVIARLEGKYGLPSLVAGHRSEADQIKRVVELAQVRGANPRHWLGRDGELPLLAGLSTHAKLYLGNDTGPMHVAAAVGTPVVALFGGGTWPRFIPRGQQSIAIVGDMPCFGCGWDCIFGDAPCMSLVTIEDVESVLQDILSSSSVYLKENQVRRASRMLDSQTEVLVAKAFRIHKEIQQDRLTRLDATNQMTRLLKQSEAAIDTLKRQLAESEADRAERLKVIDMLGGQLAESEADRAARLQVIEKQGKQLAESESDRSARLAAIEDLEKLLQESETDRANRLKVIEAERNRYSALRNQFLVRVLIKLGLIRDTPV